MSLDWVSVPLLSGCWGPGRHSCRLHPEAGAGTGPAEEGPFVRQLTTRALGALLHVTQAESTWFSWQSPTPELL